MIAAAITCADHTALPAGRTGPRASKTSSTTPMPIKVQATETGAITGPIHGTGIRNKTSQVSSEAGQLRMILSQT